MSKISQFAKQLQPWRSQTWGDLRSFAAGYRVYKKSGVTPPEAYMSMRRLYKRTNGRFNDAMGRLNRTLHWKQRADLNDSAFENVTAYEIKAAARSIQKDGFYKFDRQLPAEACHQLLSFSLSEPGNSRTLQSDGETATVFDRKNPQAIRHQYSAESLFQNPVVQTYATDPYFFSIAQEYLGFNPVFDVMTMWWSTPTQDEQMQSRAAQLYHFDMDRLKFVKFFVYLTDVGPDNGPHCYVRGSHIRKPAELLVDGRLSDEEVLRHYSSTDLVELTGPTGTMLAVDTRGFHKGKPLVAGDRLIFQIQYADSLFGQQYPPIAIPHNLDHRIADRLKSNQRCFSNLSLAKAS